MPRLLRRLSPVLALFFLAPLVGEFFLGDFPVVLIFLLVAFAPLYGGGALLIREFTRRSGRGWPTMILLGLAYGVFEEGLITQSLFNPNYMDDNLLAPGYVSWLHTGILWLVYVVSLHTFWSISVPIALVEEATPRRRTSPWLGWKGLTVVAVLFVLGSFALYNENLQLNHHWTASVGECVSIVVIVVLLVVVAFRLPKRSTAGTGATAGSVSPAGAVGSPDVVDAGSPADAVGAGNPADVVDAGSPADAGGSAGKAAAVDAGSAGAGDSAGFVPSGWVAAAVALVGGLIFKAGLIMPVWPEAVAAFLVGPVIVLVLTARWSRRAGWGQEQRLGIAGGTLLTYSWAAFTAHSASFVIDLISHVIYALAAIALLYRVARRMHAPEKHEPTPDAR